MPPSDDTRNSEEPRGHLGRTAGAGILRAPHHNGAGPDMVNPFQLAIAELQADTDELSVPPSRQPAAEPAPAPQPTRQTIMLTQPVRALGIGSWIAVAAVAMGLGLLGGAIARGFGSKDHQAAAEIARAQLRIQELEQQVEAGRGTEQQLTKAREADHARLLALSADLRRLDGKLDAQAKSTPPVPTAAEVKALVDKEVTQSLTPLDGRVKELDGSAAKLADTLRGLRAEVAGLRGKLETLDRTTRALASRATPAPETGRREEKPTREPNLAQGIELFQKGKYKDALSVFNKLELSTPDDARVWYFAALSLGLLTSEWGGGTAELVLRGIERERAGTPDSAAIDFAFKDLTVTTGKAWLEEYRKRGRERAGNSTGN